MSAKTETGGGARAAEPVLIHVWIRNVEPVAGRIALDGRPAAAFAGWLHLLQRLSDLMAFAPQAKEEPIRSPRRSPRAELRDRNLGTSAEQADHEPSVRQLMHDETKEEK